MRSAAPQSAPFSWASAAYRVRIDTATPNAGSAKRYTWVAPLFRAFWIGVLSHKRPQGLPRAEGAAVWAVRVAGWLVYAVRRPRAHEGLLSDSLVHSWFLSCRVRRLDCCDQVAAGGGASKHGAARSSSVSPMLPKSCAGAAGLAAFALARIRSTVASTSARNRAVALRICSISSSVSARSSRMVNCANSRGRMRPNFSGPCSCHRRG